MTDSTTSKIGASKSIYYSLTDDVPDITEEEKEKLEAVLKKAQEFEAEEAYKMRQPVEGKLFKYTNVVKGWQYRWFVLTPDTGMFEYFMLDEKKKSRPRGGLHLAGAVAIPSEEDNQSFQVNAVCGEVYKLKASDAKERQFWVNTIRTVIEKCDSEVSEVSAETDISSSADPVFNFCKSSTFHVMEEKLEGSPSHASSEKNVSILSDKPHPISEIKDSVYKAVACQKLLAKSVEDLPCSGPSIKCSDRKLLLIKATSQATVQSLEQCFLILQKIRQRELLNASKPSVIASSESLDKSKSNMKRIV